MSAPSSLVVSSLDFDTIRSSLVNFLRGQARFADLDFEGSNISVLLDLLSYNTYLNNFYTNLAISESFLDSAQLRDSVVSRAKELNYIPRSVSSAKAYVDITLTPNTSPAAITIPAGFIFNARIDNDIFTFSTSEDYIVYDYDNYTSANTLIYEGIFITESFQADTSQEDQKFILNNTSIDTSSLKVIVQTSSTDTTNSEFIQATSLLGFDDTSEIFFVQATDKNRYELVFGDGNVGKALINGNIISATYRNAKGPLANKADTFTPASTISGSTIVATTVTAAYGGTEAETIASIKYNAPRHYQVQERAVTPEDYRIILLQKYPTIRAISVYGGENLDPPQYGMVLISVDFNEFDGIPGSIKNDIESFIQTKMPISLEPSVVEPAYTYIDVLATADYNTNRSTKSVSDIESLITTAIRDYNTDNLNDFEITFRYSKLAAAIDDADVSIVSSNLVTRLIKRIEPTLGETNTISLKYETELEPLSFISSNFVYSGSQASLQDDGLGVIYIATLNGTTETILKNNIGTVDYTTGVVALNFPSIDEYSGNYISCYTSPVLKDFSCINNSILLINNSDITVTATPVRIR